MESNLNEKFWQVLFHEEWHPYGFYFYKKGKSENGGKKHCVQKNKEGMSLT